ncbi:MAG: xanthine phosphoribosyltransferase [Oscillospiraceae bacterium]|jgi:xanthine phosphoribosyltransferase|nr:xanthine phosphoribosyltransferase [Oscillospiraceae bacterium]
MQKLQERIRSEGQILPGNILKVDGFLNHRVDMALTRDMTYEFAKRFDLTGLTAVLTVEASGVALGAMCAAEWNVPLLFAKKAKSDNIEGGLYKSEIYSYTYKKDVTLLMSMQWLGSSDKVLIIDDFLANGEALRGLVDIVSQAKAELIGIGIAIEKGFQQGGKLIREAGYNLQSLAIIEKMDENDIIFR